MAHYDNSTSRYITFCDIPNVTEFRATFVYNFFVTDERTNASGNPRFQGGVNTDSRGRTNNKGKKFFKFRSTQKEVSEKTVQLQLPRYTLITFTGVSFNSSLAPGPDGDPDDSKYLEDPYYISHLNDETTMTTIRDAAYRTTDSHVRSRIYDRAELVSKLLDVDIADSTSATAAIINEDDTINENNLRDVITPLMTPGVTYVNEVGALLKPPIFSKASGFQATMFLDRRILMQTLGGNYERESITKRLNSAIATDDASSYLPTATTDGDGTSFMPTFLFTDPVQVGAPDSTRRAYCVGYIIERRQLGNTGQLLEQKTFYLPGRQTTSFIDTTVVYGATYVYSVRTVARIMMTVPGTQTDLLPYPFNMITVLIASSNCRPQTVTARETLAPKEPDGVFYRYNYDGGGLVLKWQLPVGKQRDTRYFQIFRRKTINDPFVCVAELDFDNSEVKSTRTELVNPSRVYKFSGPVLSFIDVEFDRQSSYIYALVAVDAHGLTSGYSTQTRVTFDRNRNKIDLDYISKAGAPKQYPNFFVDPDLDDNIFVDSLTQDSMMISNKHKLRVYFDPDATSYTRVGSFDNPQTTSENVTANTNDVIRSVTNDNARYKLHLINTDRQKSTSLEIAIEDLGSS